MGETNSKELNTSLMKKRSLKEIDDIYSMFDQTIDVVKTSKIMSSNLSQDRLGSSLTQSALRATKISNLDSVLDQLLESFTEKKIYHWGSQIPQQFKHHFRNCFEEIWPINKEEFYLILLRMCKFDTADFQEELKQMAMGLDLSVLPNRASYQQYFLNVGVSKIEENLPQSFIGEEVSWEDSFREQGENEKKVLDLQAINASIINDDYQLQGAREEPHSDFLPLFISKPKIEGGSRTELASRSQMNHNADMSRTVRIQNSSLIMPETVFIDRMSRETRAEIGDLVKFYRQFANALQQLFFSVSLISSPFKHFLFELKEKLKRKKIRPQHHQDKRRHLLFSETEQARTYRQRRQINNNILLQQIRDFGDAYTEFVWKYLQLYEITESKLGRLINTDTLYGIVLKSVWRYVEWISDRGSEYEEFKLQQLYQNIPVPNHTKIPQGRKDYLLTVLKTLRNEKNPQKYLKKIVIFYRQVNKNCTCADDLLNIYEQLVILLVKQGLSSELGIFRMRNVITKLLKIDDGFNTGGEISYSWTTWNIMVEMLHDKIMSNKYGAIFKKSETAVMETEPDYESVMVEGASPN